MPVARVLYFSDLRRRLELEGESVWLPTQTTATAVLERLGDLHPDCRELIASSRLAVNQEFVEGALRIQPGTEVALITAVSGG